MADDRPTQTRLGENEEAFADSPLSWQWDEFIGRWQSALTRRAASQSGLTGPASEGAERSPVRLLDVLEERPLLFGQLVPLEDRPPPELLPDGTRGRLLLGLYDFSHPLAFFLGGLL